MAETMESQCTDPEADEGNSLLEKQSTCIAVTTENISPVVEKATSDHNANGVALSGSQTACKKRGRGRPPVNQQGDRRKARLKELVSQCSNDELMEIAMPKLVSSSSLWHFLLANSNSSNQGQSQVAKILNQYDNFRQKVKAICREKLSKIPELTKIIKSENSTDNVDSLPPIQPDTSKTYFENSGSGFLEIFDTDLARCLGLELGRYKVDDAVQQMSENITDMDCSQLSHSNHNNDVAINNGPDAIVNNDEFIPSAENSIGLVERDSLTCSASLPFEMPECDTMTISNENMQDVGKSENSVIDTFEYSFATSIAEVIPESVALDDGLSFVSADCHYTAATGTSSEGTYSAVSYVASSDCYDTADMVNFAVCSAGSQQQLDSTHQFINSVPDHHDLLVNVSQENIDPTCNNFSNFTTTADQLEIPRTVHIAADSHSEIISDSSLALNSGTEHLLTSVGADSEEASEGVLDDRTEDGDACLSLDAVGTLFTNDTGISSQT